MGPIRDPGDPKSGALPQVTWKSHLEVDATPLYSQILSTFS